MQSIGGLASGLRPKALETASTARVAAEEIPAAPADGVEVRGAVVAEAAPVAARRQGVEAQVPASLVGGGIGAALADVGGSLKPHVEAMGASPAFGRLDPSVQQLAMKVLAYIDRAEPQGVRDASRAVLAERGLQVEGDGRLHVSRMVTLDGFTALPVAAQKKLLLATAGGGTPHVLLTMLTEKKLATLPAEAQAATLQQLARDLPLATRLEEPPRLSMEGKAIYDYGETPYVVPTPDGRQARLTGHAYGVTLGDRVVPVVVPAQDPPAQGVRFPSLLEVTRALRALPDELRDGIEAVTVCPVRKASKNGLDGGALADSGAGGVPGMIRFFASADWEQGVVDGTMVHEAGHVRTNAAWGREGRLFSDAQPSAGWASWRQAMEADEVSPSGYARVAPTEDFSETVRAAFLFRGTPLEADFRALMPHRAAVLDSLVPSWAT